MLCYLLDPDISLVDISTMTEPRICTLLPTRRLMNISSGPQDSAGTGGIVLLFNGTEIIRHKLCSSSNYLYVS